MCVGRVGEGADAAKDAAVQVRVGTTPCPYEVRAGAAGVSHQEAKMKLKIAVAVSVVLAFPVQAAELWQLGEGRGVATQHSIAGVAHRSVQFATDVLAARPATLELALPGAVVQFALTDATIRADGVRWQGHVAGKPEQQLQLTQHKGMLAGLMSLHDVTYELIPLDVGQSTLVRLRHDLYPACAGAHPAGIESGSAPWSAPEGSGPGSRDRPGDVDVLIVHTETTRVAAGGVVQIETTAQAAVDNANAAFANSQMVTRFNLVAVREVVYAESGDPGTDLTWLRDNALIQGWRDETLADMTSLLVEDGGGGCGIGYLLTSLSPGFQAHAVQVTARSCAVGNLTYAHEHGHNMGMHHNPESASGTLIAPDAHGHWDNSGGSSAEYFRTVMSYACPSGPSCSRRKYFSNPQVSYLGRPTGIVDERNNARVGNHTADVVANFRIKTLLRSGFE